MFLRVILLFVLPLSTVVDAASVVISPYVSNGRARYLNKNFKLVAVDDNDNSTILWQIDRNKGMYRFRMGDSYLAVSKEGDPELRKGGRHMTEFIRDELADKIKEVLQGKRRNLHNIHNRKPFLDENSEEYQSQEDQYDSTGNDRYEDKPESTTDSSKKYDESSKKDYAKTTGRKSAGSNNKKNNKSTGNRSVRPSTRYSSRNEVALSDEGGTPAREDPYPIITKNKSKLVKGQEQDSASQLLETIKQTIDSVVKSKIAKSEVQEEASNDEASEITDSLRSSSLIGSKNVSDILRSFISRNDDYRQSRKPPRASSRSRRSSRPDTGPGYAFEVIPVFKESRAKGVVIAFGDLCFTTDIIFESCAIPDDPLKWPEYYLWNMYYEEDTNLLNALRKYVNDEDSYRLCRRSSDRIIMDSCNGKAPKERVCIEEKEVVSPKRYYSKCDPKGLEENHRDDVKCPNIAEPVHAGNPTVVQAAPLQVTVSNGMVPVDGSLELGLANAISRIAR